DYLLLVHPESRGRVAKFYEWKPNIYTDYHEMGAHSTFFFQPGVPSRNNPLTPEKNYELTAEIAQYHATALDNIGSHYFSEERFDDFYYGKGSSFPDVNGSIGILFEQAGYRGRIRETPNGTRNFAFAIRNQFTVTLSTLEAAMNMKNELLEFQKTFYEEALELAEKDSVKAYIFGDENDEIKTQIFINFLNQHQISVYKNEKEVVKNGTVFKPSGSYVVPVKQKQYRLVKSLFEEVSVFSDTIFYDVSTWTMPYAFDIPFAKIKKRRNLNYSSQKAQHRKNEGSLIGGKSNMGYLFRWNEFNAPTTLYELQKEGIVTKVATEKFSFTVNGHTEDFSYGTVLISVSSQTVNQEQLLSTIKSVAKETGIDVYGLQTGLSPRGIDLGSDKFERIGKPQILMLIGDGVSSRDAGEIWHLFDERYSIPLTMTESTNLKNVNLNRYNSIILPGGSYREIRSAEIIRLKSWVDDGGTLILYKSAASWAGRNDFIKVEFKNAAEADTTLRLNYTNRGKQSGLNAISGAIFNAEIDLSHPLCYGYTDKQLPVFKTGNSVVQPLDDRHAQPVKFSVEPYVSGFVSPKNLERIKNAPVVSVEKSGKGKIISYHENMTFRGIWLGTNKLFSNAVFFGNVIH
ncbi:MAG: zinc carboxypeptidase, partial [Prolixibacteraceae bacterium]